MVHQVFTVQIIGIHPKILKELNHEITDCWVYYIMYNLNWLWGRKLYVKLVFFLMIPSVNQKAI